MIRRYRWTLAFYLGLGVYVILQNLDSKTIVSEISSEATEGMKGISIPAPYLASLPEIRDNGGKVPDAIANANVVPYVVEVHRGWPSSFQNEFGYRYEISNPAAGYSTTLSGFPKSQGVDYMRLIVNCAGVFAIALLLHTAVVLFARQLYSAGSVPQQRSSG